LLSRLILVLSSFRSSRNLFIFKLLAPQFASNTLAETPYPCEVYSYPLMLWFHNVYLSQLSHIQSFLFLSLRISLCFGLCRHCIIFCFCLALTSSALLVAF
jgi:hypothetical protein